jgi:hypothetical protein
MANQRLTKIFAGVAVMATAFTFSVAKANEASTDAYGLQPQMDLTQQPSLEQLQYAEELPATLVLRLNERTNELEVFNSDGRLQKDPSTHQKVTKAKFKKMSTKSKMKGRGKGSNLTWSPFSWLLGFSLGNWNSPYYSYRGYSYPYSYYDSYSYGGYSYYYYGYPYGW